LVVTRGQTLVVTVGVLQGTLAEFRGQINQPQHEYGNVEESITKLKLFPIADAGKQDLAFIVPQVAGRYSFYVCGVDPLGRWSRTGQRRFLDVQ